MTAEVAVLNREAVAIAADSAVTLTSPERDEQKIYNTANKIFVLSEIEPLAVMIYGPTSLKRKHCFPPELNPRYFRRLGFELPGTVNTAREVQ